MFKTKPVLIMNLVPSSPRMHGSGNVLYIANNPLSRGENMAVQAGPEKMWACTPVMRTRACTSRFLWEGTLQGSLV